MQGYNESNWAGTFAPVFISLALGEGRDVYMLNLIFPMCHWKPIVMYFICILPGVLEYKSAIHYQPLVCLFYEA